VTRLVVRRSGRVFVDDFAVGVVRRVSARPLPRGYVALAGPRRRRVGIFVRRRAAVDAVLGASGICTKCLHRHVDGTGRLGCAWCPCGHPTACGCMACEQARSACT
jgi:hypothetical protein